MQMLIQDTTSNQRKQGKYQIRYDKDGEMYFSAEQRNWIQHMLRKNLGHKNIAFFIWQHGLPELLEAPLRMKPQSREQLQSILEEGIHWHASLLQSLVAYSTGPELEHARRMSDLGQAAWRRPKRQTYFAAKEKLKRGKRLCEQRDSKKRGYDEMSATEQQILEDYDTRKSRARVKEASLRVDRKPFRGFLVSKHSSRHRTSSR